MFGRVGVVVNYSSKMFLRLTFAPSWSPHSSAFLNLYLAQLKITYYSANNEAKFQRAEGSFVLPAAPSHLRSFCVLSGGDSGFKACLYSPPGL